MNKFLHSLREDARGVAAVEFALVAPVFFLLVFGIIQFGMLMHASAGLKQGVEVGARHASIYPRPTDAQIIAKTRSGTYGIDPAYLTGPTITRGVRNGMTYAKIDVEYRREIDMAVAKLPPITLKYSRIVYQLPSS